MLHKLPQSLIAANGSVAFASSGNAVALVSWNGANAIVDNRLSITTLYGNTVPDGATNGPLVWDPLEATTPGVSGDNVSPPNSPPSATGCILAGGANCDDPRQTGKRFRLQATAAGQIDLLLDFADDTSSTAPVNAATLSTWAADLLYYAGAIDDLAKTTLNASLVFDGATAGQVTLRVTPSAVPVPAGIVLLGSALASTGIVRAIRRRIGCDA